jgi:hypothetical protein
MDEVTGLPYNTQTFTLEALDAYHYRLALNVPIGSVIKYKYRRMSDPFADEYSAEGKPIRYRLYYVDGPSTVEDVVSRWQDTISEIKTGRLIGEVLDVNTGVPIPNILIEAGGLTTFTTSDGSFVLQGLPPGKHILMAYAIDGSYQTYKQEAVIASEAATPAVINLRSSQYADVVFTVTLPPDTVYGIPVRLAGNLLQLGNTFADLSGGTSTLAIRMPELTYLSDNIYSLAISLPTGVDIRYKYTLGDGLWNAEHNPDGSYTIRRLIIPPGTQTLNQRDEIATWQAGNYPIWFDYQFPNNTPQDEHIFIQFSLFGWMQPIPLWQAEKYRWGYRLSGPTNISGGLDYRFCRNGQCGYANPIAVDSSEPHHADPNSPEAQIGTIENWALIEPPPGQITVLGGSIQPRGKNFIAGIEFSPTYDPSWQPYMPSSLDQIEALGANWVTFIPTWSPINISPPNLALTASEINWFDLVSNIETAERQNTRVALYPQINFPIEDHKWWIIAPRDKTWWNVWFERYRTFILHHADLAQRSNVETLIIGGSWLDPALPSGKLHDGSPSNVPQNVETTWRNIIDDVRVHFSGTIAWAMTYPNGIQNPVSFLDSVDMIYLEWSPPLADNPGTPAADLKQKAGNLIDKRVLPFQLEINKPFILSVAYPSVSGSATHCLQSESAECILPSSLVPPAPTAPMLQLDLMEQASVYDALLAMVNERPWIAGFVSRDYYPPAIIHDMSNSINGKPASQVLQYWYLGFMGNQ